MIDLAESSTGQVERLCYYHKNVNHHCPSKVQNMGMAKEPPLNSTATTKNWNMSTEEGSV